ncbi:MAG: XdhC family protein [Actinobacteria bacterium]|nr:XdhC family protein [Actinomycetota bacterium]
MRGEAFTLATVVWRRGPSSGKQGCRAVITASGQIHGWIGGACAEPIVVREARHALAEGMPRLIFLGTPDELETAAMREGMLFLPMSCQSEGALEIYIEPVEPKPHVVVVGRSPMAETLVQMAQTIGWRAVLVDADGGSSEDHPLAWWALGSGLLRCSVTWLIEAFPRKYLTGSRCRLVLTSERYRTARSPSGSWRSW